MFKTIIKTKDKTGIIRADVMNYRAIGNVSPVFSSLTNGTNNTSQSVPIRNYTVTLYLGTGKAIMININDENDLNDFIDKLIMAEEEQMTVASISMEELYQYAAEKILGNKHEAIPGVKLSVIEVNGTIIDDTERIYTGDRLDDHFINKHTSLKGSTGGFYYGV